jgi:hypothetical protein
LGIGYLLEDELNPKIRGRNKPSTATAKELIEEPDMGEFASKLAAVWSAGNFAGMYGRVGAMALQLGSHPEKPLQTPFVSPAIEGINEASAAVADLIQAMKEGQDVPESLAKVIDVSLRNMNQSWNIIRTHTEKNEQGQEREDRRDLQVFRNLTGKSSPTPPAHVNVATGADVKEFKNSKSVQEAKESLDKVVTRLEKIYPEPYRLVDVLEGMKNNPSGIYPSMEGTDSSKMDYVQYQDFVKRTQGEKAQGEKFERWVEQKKLDEQRDALIEIKVEEIKKRNTSKKDQE